MAKTQFWSFVRFCKTADGSFHLKKQDDNFMNTIKLRGVNTHNLKNIHLDLPRNQLIVFTGLSGSGKSSLAFDTLYAEGQRRYVESLSVYARQFMSLMEKPEFDHIEGLSPAIAIEQKSTSHNPRSTVGTVTEIYDYLRLLFARVGEPRCPQHHTVLNAQTVSQMVDQILALPENTAIMLLAPVVKGRKGEHQQLFTRLQQAGFLRARVNGEVILLDEPPVLDLYKKHHIDVVIDRLKVRAKMRLRLAESLETALQWGEGLAEGVLLNDVENPLLFSANYACPQCGYSLPELEPRLFSFNNPAGACPDCDGLGIKQFFTADKVVSDKNLSLAQGAIRGWDKRTGYYFQMLAVLAQVYHFDLSTPFIASGHNLKAVNLELPIGLFIGITGVSGSGKSTLINDTLYPLAARELNRANTEAAPYVRIEGLEFFDKVVDINQSPIGRTPRSNPATYTGVFTPLRELFAATVEARSLGYSAGRFSFNVKGGRCEACRGDGVIKVAMHFLPDVYVNCDVCHGQRYNLETLNIEYKGKNIADVLAMTVEEAAQFFAPVPVLKRKLHTLMDVGLSYLTLGQNAVTLSGGEAQRVKLSRELSKRDTGQTLYILDEPTTGLHFYDIEQLLAVVHRLRDHSNTVVVIEHNLDVIKTADWIIDLGPEGGAGGGQIIAMGTPEDVAEQTQSFTGQFLKPFLSSSL